MRCQDCREYVMELFPARRYNEIEREKENVLLCLACMPKCQYSGPAGLSIQRCCEPVDYRSEYFCTAHEIAVCKLGLQQSDDDPEAAGEYRRTIAELEGIPELARAA